MKVLVACECSGIVRDAFLQRDHDAWSCDLQPTDSFGPHIQGDVFEIIEEGWDLMIAHPPCTYLAVSGAQWFYHPDDKHLPVDQRRPDPRYPHRMQDQREAIKFFLERAQAPIKRICIENPVGVMSTVWRPADQIIQPYEYGHPEPKKTCLWLKNLPKLQPTKIVEPEYRTFKSGKRLPKWYSDAKSLPDEQRRKVRSATFPGIASAMADSWGRLKPTDNLQLSLKAYMEGPPGSIP